MKNRAIPSIIVLLSLLFSNPVLATIYLTPGDIGPSSATMILRRQGLFMPKDASFVYSGTTIAYPQEFIDATSITVSLYFLAETSTPGDVRIRCRLNSYNVGDIWNLGGHNSSTLAVPVSGTTSNIYVQIFEFSTVPAAEDLLSLSIARQVAYGDTYVDGIYLHAINIEPHSSVSAIESELPPRNLDLMVQPNPFNPATMVSFTLPSDGPTSVEVYDIRGRLVDTLCAGKHLVAGHQEFTWQPKSLPSGTYLIRVESADLEETLKVGLIR